MKRTHRLICQIMMSLSSPPEARNLPFSDHRTQFTHPAHRKFKTDHIFKASHWSPAQKRETVTVQSLSWCLASVIRSTTTHSSKNNNGLSTHPFSVSPRRVHFTSQLKLCDEKNKLFPSKNMEQTTSRYPRTHTAHTQDATLAQKHAKIVTLCNA